LGVTANDADWLRDVLLAAARTLDASPASSSAWGEQWRLDVPVTREQRQAVLRTIWLVAVNEKTPRFVTAWVL
jgi:hypothetical protein